MSSSIELKRFMYFSGRALHNLFNLWTAELLNPEIISRSVLKLFSCRHFWSLVEREITFAISINFFRAITWLLSFLIKISVVTQ